MATLPFGRVLWPSSTFTRGGEELKLGEREDEGKIPGKEMAVRMSQNRSAGWSPVNSQGSTFS
jgi:hypothetical protein